MLLVSSSKLLYLVSGEGTQEEPLAFPAQSHPSDFRVKCLFPGRGLQEQACVCVGGAEGMQHRHHIHSERCKERTLALPLHYHSPNFDGTWLGGLSTPLTKWPLTYLPGFHFRTLAFAHLTLRCAGCQNQSSSSQPLIFLLAYLCELSFWVAKCSFPSRNKKSKLLLCEPPPVKRYFLPGCCGLVWR